ncbi:MAG TPA: ABC transporter permease, partial [Thauera sp.]|nr:ABC transporter permease [Thauera sp.]
AHGRDFVALLGQLLLDLLHLLRHPREWPLLEISANVFKVGVKAMPVSALVGFLIGVVLSYLSALQLRTFGADVFIVNILGMGIIRELGPVLVSVLVAGRSGSAMTAQLGVMRVTEEIDALAAMGVSRSVRLVLPKVVALALA